MRGQADASLVDQLRQAGTLVGDDDPPLSARLVTVAAAHLDLLGHSEEARLVAGETLAAARRSGSRLAELNVLHFYTTWGEEDDQLAAAVRGAALAEELGEVWQSCKLTSRRWRVATSRHRRTGLAVPWLDRLRRVAEGNCYGLWRYYIACFDSMFALARGDFAEAERLADPAEALLPDGTNFTTGVHGMQMFAVWRGAGGRVG